MNARHLKSIIWTVKAVVWLVWAPFNVTYSFYRWIGKLFGAWFLTTTDLLHCPGCGENISLVGRWECAWCSFVFDGFFFARCNVCGAVPQFIQCQQCGVGVRNPMLFP